MKKYHIWHHFKGIMFFIVVINAALAGALHYVAVFGITSVPLEFLIIIFAVVVVLSIPTSIASNPHPTYYQWRIFAKDNMGFRKVGQYVTLMLITDVRQRKYFFKMFK